MRPALCALATGAAMARRRAFAARAMTGEAVDHSLRAEEVSPAQKTVVSTPALKGCRSFYTAMDIPVAEHLAKAFEARYQRAR